MRFKILALVFGVCSLASTAAMALTEGSLTQVEREKVNVGDLLTKSQTDLNTLYQGITSGPIPDGESQGYVVFDDSGDNEVDKIFHAINPDGKLEDFVKALGTSLWKGKIFYRNQGMLMNRVGMLARFPAQVLCGPSKFDTNKPSIILDYSRGDLLPGYDKNLDWAMTRDGLDIRDEIRMVKPGLYLGRAYARGVYVLNFIIAFPNGSDTPTAWTDSCH